MQQIIQVLNKTTPEDKIEGKKWYSKAHDYCQSLAEEFGIDLKIVVGITSSLSPRREWSLNKRQVRQYLEGKRNLHTRLQMNKCNLIYAGKDIETCLGGLKTINFYRNILNPSDKEPITLDVHILKMYPEITVLTPKKYESIKKDFVEIAKQKGTIGNRIQSQCWLTIKKNKLWD